MLNIPLMDDTFRNIRDYIFDLCGIYISDNKKYLIENRLAKILTENKLNSFEEYLKFIKICKNGNNHSRLIDAITTNETYFFREPDQLNIFISEILPKISNQKPEHQNIRIWSSACSSGEEPYTISMMLKEKLLDLSKYEIYGSDISEGVLSSAAKGVYSSYSVRNVPEAYLKKYFTSNGDCSILDSSIKKSIIFKRINLIDSKNINLIRGVDVIFCRNMLIYFNIKSKQKVISHLYDCLNPGGYLFVGASESLHNVTRAFRPSVINKVIIYKKV